MFIIDILVTIFASWLFISLAQYYYAYCDMGINNSANSFFLTFVLFPILLTCFSLVLGLLHNILKKKFKGNGKFAVFKYMGLSVAFLLVFLVFIVLQRNYPGNTCQTALTI